jgi:hypothetical protein
MAIVRANVTFFTLFTSGAAGVSWLSGIADCVSSVISRLSKGININYELQMGRILTEKRGSVKGNPWARKAIIDSK